MFTKTAGGANGPGDLDWSKFDFTRWNLNGFPVGDPSSAIVSLVQTMTSTPQWPEAFGATLPLIKRAVLQQLTAHLQELQSQSGTFDSELEARLADIQGRITALQDRARAASTPPAVDADPNRFQLVAKAVDRESQVGLPGLTVLLTEAAHPDKALATGTTDDRGTVLLSLSEDQLNTLAGGGDLTLTLLAADGKPLTTIDKAVCAALNHVGTYVLPVDASAETASSLAAAKRVNDRENSRLLEFVNQPDQLKALYASRKQALLDSITELQNTIAAIQSELSGG